MRQLIFAEDAERDLIGIAEWIARDRPNAARRMVDRIEAAAKKLAKMPTLGHFRDDVDDPRYRFLRVRPYMIAYRCDDQSVTVLRVVHGARDFRQVFGGQA